MWVHLLQRASIQRIEGYNDKYIVAVDAIVRSLLKDEREPIKKLKGELMSEVSYGFDDKLAVYDRLYEAIVDKLEDSGFLTKDFVISATTVQLEPDEED